MDTHDSMTNSGNENNFRLHAVVEGRVQGVGFRYFVLDIATYLQLTGWVRNTFSGDVEVLAEGERDKLEKLAAYLWQGPPSSMVENVNLRWEAATNEFTGFHIRHTI